MIVVLIRIILLILPLTALVYYLRWRAGQKKAGELKNDADLVKIRAMLILLIVFLIVAWGILRLSDITTKDRDKVYVPPHVENGRLVPAEFKDREELERQAREKPQEKAQEKPQEKAQEKPQEKTGKKAGEKPNSQEG